MNRLSNQVPAKLTDAEGLATVNCRAIVRTRPRVAIIGGGPGGLMTAYLLQKKSGCLLDVSIFEASNRVGGKILTPQFSLAPVSYEAGAAEFYDYSPVDTDPLKALILELGLPISPMGGNSLYIDGRFISNLDDVERYHGAETREAWQQFHREARDFMSPMDFYLSGSPEATPHAAGSTSFREYLTAIRSQQVRHMIECQIHSDLATETDQTDTDYGLQNYLMNDPAYLQLYGIEGGNARLPQELARRCQATIRLEQSVRTIGKDEQGDFHVCFEERGNQMSAKFDFVVIALPHDALPRLAFEGTRLQTAMQRHYAHYHHPAHYLRITILFQRPFWRNRWTDSFCMLDSFGGCCLYDESSRLVEPRYGVLGWLIGGQAAIDNADLADEALLELALDTMPRELGDARKNFLEGRVHRWLGAVNALPGGRTSLPVAQRHCPEPLDHEGLFVVGDYLYDSTINGVLDSADYVSDGIAALVDREPQLPLKK